MFLGITEQWGVLWAADSDYTKYLVQYECLYDIFGFMEAGIYSDQINIYTRDGKPPTPTEMATIKSVVASKGSTIDMKSSNLEPI